MTSEPPAPSPRRPGSPLRRRLGLPLLVILVAFFALWIVGPEPIRSGPYVQAITPTSAVISRIDRAESAVRLRYWPTADPSAARTAAGGAPSRFHEIAVDGLSPATAYTYEIENLGPDGAVTARDGGDFVTAHADPGAPVRFVAVGDTGRTPWWFRNFNRFGWMRARPLFAAFGGLKPQWDIARAMVEKRPDLMLHLGDVVYPKGELSYYEEALFRPFDQLLRTVPMYPAIGNHDGDGLGGHPYEDVFHLPSDPPSGTELHYSFVRGPVRFVMLNTQGHTGRESAQVQWLDRTLAANQHPWTIVAMHAPVFCSTKYSDNEELKRDLWPTLVKHEVDLVLTGHSHGYQRFEPIDGITQVIAGGGGHSIYETVPDERLAAHDDDYGFLLIEVRSDLLTGELWTPDGVQRDRFQLLAR